MPQASGTPSTRKDVRDRVTIRPNLFTRLNEWCIAMSRDERLVVERLVEWLLLDDDETVIDEKFRRISADVLAAGGGKPVAPDGAKPANLRNKATRDRGR